MTPLFMPRYYYGVPETNPSAPTRLNLPPSPETPLTPHPTVLKSSPRKNRKIIVAAVASFILVLSSFFVVRDYHEWSAIKAVDSYEACVAAKGSTTYDSCPLSCTTRYKDKFIDSSPCPEPALDPVIKAVGDTDTTSSWRVFADDNITFKYPADGVISQRNNSLIELTYSPNKYRVRFTFHPATKQSLDKYLTETYLPDADGNHTTSPLKQVQIAGYRGFAAGVYAVDSGWFSYVVLESPDAKANVDIEYFTDVLKEPADKEVFYQILSTFKFLDQNDVNETFTIDFSACPNGRKSVTVAFGSTTYEVTGKKLSACEINYGGEVENPNWDGKLDTNCLVPISLGKIEFKTNQYGVDFSPIKNYCSAKK